MSDLLVRFRTFGPFELPRDKGVVSRNGLKTMWKNIKTANEGLDKGIGVYLVSTISKNGTFIPWYVGKTEKGFKNRLYQHVTGGASFVTLNEHLPSDGSLYVFFLARVTPKRGAFRKKISAGEKIKSVGALEDKLIGDCLKLNDRLLNVSNAIFHANFSVTGYLNDSVSERDKPAKMLAKLLKKK